MGKQFLTEDRKSFECLGCGKVFDSYDSSIDSHDCEKELLKRQVEIATELLGKYRLQDTWENTGQKDQYNASKFVVRWFPNQPWEPADKAMEKITKLNEMIKALK